MRNWFDVAPAVCVVMPSGRSREICDTMYVARDRLIFRADGSWLAAVVDFQERYHGDVFMVGIEIHQEGDKTKRRYVSRGYTNYLVKVPLGLIDGLSPAAMTAFFEEVFIDCCIDAATRWETTINWRVEPELRSPTN